MHKTLTLLAAVLAAGGTSFAQANANPNIDVELAFIDNFQERGRTGAFPNGLNGFAMSTTICNRGTQIVEWMAAMNPNHPFITFLVARESNGRFEQISDWSYVKHGWFALASSQCTPCTPPPSGAGPYLGLGCSDTYGVGNNGDRYDLGPPAEIDPWLGQWDPNCSHFDLGLSGTTCDGNRSLTNAQVSTYNSVENRIQILDADLDVVGADFYYQGFYAVESEPDAVREDNMSHRAIDFTWTGSQWNPSAQGSIEHGSILERWSGAEIGSARNNNDDGRVYVAVRTTGPDPSGAFHYEYAFHNRDNNRGIGEIQIPVCPNATVSNVGFHDVDSDAANDWSWSFSNGVLSISTTDNPLRWNSIYNVWFDSNTIPQNQTSVELFQFDPGPGQPSFTVTHPAALPTVGDPNVVAGPGCGPFPATYPRLAAYGTPAQALLGNASFGVRVEQGFGNQPAYLFYSQQQGSIPLGGTGCTIYLGGMIFLEATGTTDPFGRVDFDLPVPLDTNLNGLTFTFQAAVGDPLAGPAFGGFDLSEGLDVLVGLPGVPSTCP